MTKKSSKRLLVPVEGIRRVVIYVRVSSKKQVKEGHSLGAQMSILEKYARDNGWEIVARFEEPGLSARDAGRKGLRRMVEFVMVPQNAVDAILVYMSSRFYRDSMKARLEKQLLAQYGVRVLAMLNKTEDSPSGRLAERVYEAFDEYESDVIGVRTRMGMSENARKGYLNGSKVPFGFRADAVRDGDKTRRKAILCPEEADILRLVFRLYGELTGAKSVAMELARRGVRYRRGTPWDKDKVLNVLRNPACIGRIEWGRFDSRTGEERQEEDLRVIDCERIIEQDLWESTQVLLAKRDPQRTPGQTTTSPLLLAGVTTCGLCGGSLTLETAQKTMNDGQRITHRYYNCRRFIRIGPSACPGFRIPEQRLDGAVLEFIGGHVFSTERCPVILREVLSQTGGIQQKTREKRAELEAIRTDVERRIRRWEDAFESNGDFEEPERYKELQARRRELDQAIRQLRELRPPPLDLNQPEVVRRFRELLLSTFRNPDRSMARKYVRLLVERIMVHPRGPKEAEIEVISKGTGAVALMATARSASPVLTAAGAVHTSVGDWLQLQDSNLGPGG